MKKIFYLFLFFTLFFNIAFASNVRKDSSGNPLYAADRIKVKLAEVAYERLNSVLSENGDFSDTGLDESTAYTYIVGAYNSAGTSWSGSASATTPECVAEPPDAPTGLKAKQPGRAPKVQLEWNDNSTNEVGFRIYRTIGSTTSMLIELGPNTTSYEDNNFTSGETYTYTVCAHNDSGESCSSSVDITTK